MYRIAINTAKNLNISLASTPATDVDVDESVGYTGANVLLDQQGPESILHGEEMAVVVRDALESLPEDLRTAVTLREFDGLSYEDIADVMDCPLHVRSEYSAREAIDKQLSPALVIDD